MTGAGICIMHVGAIVRACVLCLIALCCVIVWCVLLLGTPCTIASAGWKDRYSQPQDSQPQGC